MHPIFDVDWRALFVPTVSLFELVLRGSAMYILILAALRVFRREAGGLNTADLLVIVLIADAAQNAMASDYHSITEGLVLVATIFLWNYIVDWLSYRYRWIYQLLNRPPLPLIDQGRIQRRNLRMEMITLEELLEQLREQGVDDVTQVKRCCLESDGHISVIRQGSSEDAASQRKSPAF